VNAARQLVRFNMHSAMRAERLPEACGRRGGVRNKRVTIARGYSGDLLRLLLEWLR
jgi:hypothetical protein